MAQPHVWICLSTEYEWPWVSKEWFAKKYAVVKRVQKGHSKIDRLPAMHSSGVVGLYIPEPTSVFNWKTGTTELKNANTLISVGSSPAQDFGVWDLDTRKSVRKFRLSNNNMSCCDVLGTKVMVASMQGKLRLVDLVSPSLNMANAIVLKLDPLMQHTSAVTCVKLCKWINSSYGNLDGVLRGVSGSYDHHVKLWNMETGRCTHLLAGHMDEVWSVAVHPVEPIVASGSSDGTVRVWRIGADAQYETISVLACRGHKTIMTIVFATAVNGRHYPTQLFAAGYDSE